MLKEFLAMLRRELRSIARNSILHKSPLSITATISVNLRNKLDYKLSRFSSPLSPGSSSQPITDVTLKEFLAMLRRESRSIARNSFNVTSVMGCEDEAEDEAGDKGDEKCESL